MTVAILLAGVHRTVKSARTPCPRCSRPRRLRYSALVRTREHGSFMGHGGLRARGAVCGHCALCGASRALASRHVPAVLRRRVSLQTVRNLQNNIDPPAGRASRTQKTRVPGCARLLPGSARMDRHAPRPTPFATKKRTKSCQWLLLGRE
jgi:hypothetical protein